MQEEEQQALHEVTLRLEKTASHFMSFAKLYLTEKKRSIEPKFSKSDIRFFFRNLIRDQKSEPLYPKFPKAIKYLSLFFPNMRMIRDQK
jgi:hypothetical protein